MIPRPMRHALASLALPFGLDGRDAARASGIEEATRSR